jgi:YfiH family protein
MTEAMRGETPVPGSIPRYEVPGWRERFGVVAGITGRGSPGDAFDLGMGGTAPIGPVLARWRALLALEPGFRGVIVSRQVHGVAVGGHRAAHGLTLLDGLDGHVTDRAGILLAVTVADCVPVYLVAPEVRAVGLLHAGWRGVAGGILAAGIEALRNLGADPHEIVMHCGVGICGECYEVGEEVLSACGRASAGVERGSLDLRGCLVDAAQEAGLGAVSTSQMCSAHDRDRFFSHRRSAGADGRMAAYLGILP